MDVLAIILISICAAPNSSNKSPFLTVTGTHMMILQLHVDNTNDNIDNHMFAKELQRTLDSLNSINKYYNSVNKSCKYVPGKF